jgi:hypothetical protein
MKKIVSLTMTTDSQASEIKHAATTAESVIRTLKDIFSSCLRTRPTITTDTKPEAAPSVYARCASLLATLHNNHLEGTTGKGSGKLGAISFGISAASSFYQGHGLQVVLTSSYYFGIGPIKSTLNTLLLRGSSQVMHSLGYEVDERNLERYSRQLTDLLLSALSIYTNPRAALYSEAGIQISSLLKTTLSIPLIGEVDPRVLGYQGGTLLSTTLPHGIKSSDNSHLLLDDHTETPEPTPTPALPTTTQNTTLLHTITEALEPTTAPEPIVTSNSSTFSLTDPALVYQLLQNGTAIVSIDRSGRNTSICLTETPTHCISSSDLFNTNWTLVSTPPKRSKAFKFMPPEFTGLRERWSAPHSLRDDIRLAIQYYAAGYQTEFPGLASYEVVNGILRNSPTIMRKIAKHPELWSEAVQYTILTLISMQKTAQAHGTYYRSTKACHGQHNGLGIGPCKRGALTTTSGITSFSPDGLHTGYGGNAWIILSGSPYQLIEENDWALLHNTGVEIDKKRLIPLRLITSNVETVVESKPTSTFRVVLNLFYHSKLIARAFFLISGHNVDTAHNLYEQRDFHQFERRVRSFDNPFWPMYLFHSQSANNGPLTLDSVDEAIAALNPTPKTLSISYIKRTCASLPDIHAFDRRLCWFFSYGKERDVPEQVTLMYVHETSH